MAVESVFRGSKIRDLNPSKPAWLSPSSTLASAIESMRVRGEGCVLVCDEGVLTGILTERDVLNKVIGEPAALTDPIRKYATPSPHTLSADDSLEDAVRLMVSGNYRNIPLVAGDGQVEGVLTVNHIIDFLSEMFPEEVLNLPPSPDQKMKTREGG